MTVECKSNTVCFRLTDSLRQELEAVAQRQRRTLSNIIVLMIEQGIKNFQDTGEIPLGTGQ